MTFQSNCETAQNFLSTITTAIANFATGCVGSVKQIIIHKLLPDETPPTKIQNNQSEKEKTQNIYRLHPERQLENFVVKQRL